MLTGGVDLAAQPLNTGAVVIDWRSSPPVVVSAVRRVTDQDIIDICGQVGDSGGKVGIDCPLGWPRAFVDYVTAHAARRPLPRPALTTPELRYRATDRAQVAAGGRPLSVSTDKLGSTALRAARLLDLLDQGGEPVDRSGTGIVCEVYPAASRRAWGLPADRDLTGLLDQLPLDAEPSIRDALNNEHIFDALIAAITARAVALGMTAEPGQGERELAAEEGWIHVPEAGRSIGHLLALDDEGAAPAV
ncbi:DUF429 domain-containing protein [Kineococcus sp. NUM-3379]